MVRKADFRSPRHRERIMLFPMLEELLSPPLDAVDGIAIRHRHGLSFRKPCTLPANRSIASFYPIDSKCLR